MPRLTDTQAILLTSAAARSDGSVLPVPATLSVRPADLDRALRSLLRRNLIIDRCGTDSIDGGGARRAASNEHLQISPAGLTAIGIVSEDAATGPGVGEGVEEPAVATDGDPKGKRRRSRLNRSRSADDASHSAEITSSAPDHADGAAAAVAGAAAPDRPMTKKARLIALLSTEAGADVPFLSATLGWQPHTTRAALTVLRKAGHRIETAQSPLGGGRLYRIVEQPAPEGAV